MKDMFAFDKTCLYVVRGTVVQGRKVGRVLGFRTANIAIEEGATVPECGVYAAVVLVKDKMQRAMVNVGIRPSFDDVDGRVTIEAHLFDFDEDIYDERVLMFVLKRMRDEIRFNSTTELMGQLWEDKLRVENFFKELEA